MTSIGSEAFIGTLARRIGAADWKSCPAILRQSWSALNVPIIWGAAGFYVHPFDRMVGVQGFLCSRTCISTEAMVRLAIPSGSSGLHCAK